MSPNNSVYKLLPFWLKTQLYYCIKAIKTYIFLTAVQSQAEIIQTKDQTLYAFAINNKCRYAECKRRQ